MTVSVTATSCTGIFTETFLGLRSSTVSVEFRVHEVTTATVTQHSQCSNGSEICSMGEVTRTTFLAVNGISILSLWDIQLSSEL